ncbi:hypothetical protein BH20ACI3_BH20ACI3_13670 [soil metagenome]
MGAGEGPLKPETLQGVKEQTGGRPLNIQFQKPFNPEATIRVQDIWGIDPANYH